jgi:hypothetical protein
MTPGLVAQLRRESEALHKAVFAALSDNEHSSLQALRFAAIDASVRLKHLAERIENAERDEEQEVCDGA